MHSTSNLTWSANTSATLRARFIEGSGRRAASSGQPTAQAVHIPETGTPATGDPARPEPAHPDRPRHDSSGWGEAPLAVFAERLGHESRGLVSDPLLGCQCSRSRAP